MYGNEGGGFRRGPRRSFAPVNVGDELEVTIEAVGEKGDGIAKEKGFVLFVPNTKEGQRVKIKITRVLRKVGFAEVVGEGTEAPAEEPKEEEPKEEEAEEKELFDESKATEDFGEEAKEEEPKEEEASEEPEKDIEEKGLP